MVFNDGDGVPVLMHPEEQAFIPSLIFGVLHTSSNYDDDLRKTVGVCVSSSFAPSGGRNGFGAKLCNIYSKEFVVETASSAQGLHFQQVFVVLILR